MGYTTLFLYILEQFCVGYVNYRGKSFCIGVRYFTVAFPIYRSNFAWGTQNRKGTQNYFYVAYPMQHVLINIGIILRRVHKISPIYRGKPFCVGVCYFTVAFPIYIGAILRIPMQNCSYIYRNTSLISVKVYITLS